MNVYTSGITSRSHGQCSVKVNFCCFLHWYSCTTAIIIINTQLMSSIPGVTFLFLAPSIMHRFPRKGGGHSGTASFFQGIGPLHQSYQIYCIELYSFISFVLFVRSIEMSSLSLLILVICVFFFIDQLASLSILLIFPKELCLIFL